MVALTSLVIPILPSAVIVFVASSILYMVLTYHRTDLRKIAREHEFLAAVRPKLLHRQTPPHLHDAPLVKFPHGGENSPLGIGFELECAMKSMSSARHRRCTP